MKLSYPSADLKTLKKRIDRDLDTSLAIFSDASDLFLGAKYALLGEGKRIRPILVHLTAEALGFGLDVSLAAIAVEYFHTASLIADDLPCMDNDNYRRSRPSLHRKFGETTALLTSYGFISEAFKKIEENGRLMQKAPSPFSEKALEAMSIGLNCAAQNAGFLGATLGQYEDLMAKIDTTCDLERIIKLKTVTLFEGSFVLGWVFGGGDLAKTAEIKKLAYHFGRAFQIRDDFYDIAQDRKKERPLNYALALGETKAKAQFYEEVDRSKQILLELSIYSERFEEVLSLLSDLS